MAARLVYSCLNNIISSSSSSCRTSRCVELKRTLPASWLVPQVSTPIPFRHYTDDAGPTEKEAVDKQRDPRIQDPTKEVSVETSMRYLKSDAYRQTYGDTRVWVLYRRNFPGQFAPKKTREKCYRLGKLNTGNPCPICRDEYLVLDYRNVVLLKQFISPFNGAILGTDKTGLCQEKHFKLLVEIDKAKDYGTITFDVPFREYNYEDYYPKELLEKLKRHSDNPV